MRNRNYDKYNNDRDLQAERSSSLIYADKESNSPRSRNWFEQLSRRFKLNKLDWVLILTLIVGSIYFLVREPLVCSILLSSSLFFYCLNQIFKYIAKLNRLTGFNIRFWHVAAIIVALTAVFSMFEMPAQALFLSSLETQLKTLVPSDLGTAISNVFTAIRVIFVLSCSTFSFQ